MLTRPEEVERALERCLEASLEPSLWPGILTDLSSATEALGAAIIPVKTRTPAAIISSDSLLMAFEDYFAEGWHINDWRLRGVPLLTKQGTARDQEYTTQEEFKRLAFYRWQAGVGLGKSCIIGFSSGDDVLGLVLHRTFASDFFSDEEAAIFQRVRNRLNVAAKITRALSTRTASGMADAFSSSGIAAIFFDRFCHVTAVTPAVENVLGAEIDIKNRMIVSGARRTTESIRAGMHAALSINWLSADNSQTSVFIPRSGRKPLTISIQRLGGNLPDVFSHSVGVCLIEDLEQKPIQDSGKIRQLFGLTATEAKIVAMISNDMSLRDIAEERGVSYYTVRAHLRSIFAKTDTSRQSQLPKLAARLG